MGLTFIEWWDVENIYKDTGKKYMVHMREPGVRHKEFWPFKKEGTNQHFAASMTMQAGLDLPSECIYTFPSKSLWQARSREGGGKPSAF